jgi:iron complex transport system substrate-binding protein
MIIVGFMILMCLACGCLIGSEKPNEMAQGVEGNNSIVVTDSLGSTITLSQPAQRIVCQNSGSAEILASIGAGDKIVGLSNTTISQKNYLINKTPNAQNYGDTYNPNIERLIMLKPDLFIAYSDSTIKPRNLDEIISNNMTVVYQRVYDIRDLHNETVFLGRISGHEEDADRLNKFNDKYQSLIKARIQNLSPADGPNVYFEQIVDYMAITNDSSGDYILNLVHARNVAGSIYQQNAIVSPEWVIDQNPDIIIRMVSSGNSMATIRNDLQTRQGFSRINAVKNTRIYCISGTVMSGPREVIGALYIAKAIYPDRFADIDPESILHEYAHEFLPGSDTESAFYPQLPV